MKIMKKLSFLCMLLTTVVCSVIAAYADEEVTDKDTGLLTPDYIYNQYISETKDIVENDEAFKTWMKTSFDIPAFKDDYLKFSDNNTEEKWDKLSDFDKMNFKILSSEVKSDLMNRNFKDMDDFVKQYNYYENWATNSCKDDENVAAYFVSLRKVLEWEYSYFEKNNTVYDLFNNSQSEEVTSEQLDKDPEVNDIKNALSGDDDKNKTSDKKADKNSNVFITVLKNNIVTIILAGITAILFIIVFFNKIRNKNNN